MNSPASPPPADNVLDAQAAEWLAQREMGFTPEQETEFLRWRLADPRHADALARMEETCALLEQLPALGDDPRFDAPAGAWISTETAATACASQPAAAFRKWIGVAAGLAAVLTLCAIAWWAHTALPQVPVQTFATAPSGYQRVLLPDNSLVQLNGSTALTVEFSRAERRVALAEGEAHFSVAKDIDRPFVVQVRRIRVCAIGTAFNVHRTETGVDVLVTEGIVRIERPGDPAGPVVLAANERTTVADQSAPAAACAIERVEPVAVRASLAWQEPRFVFVESPLGDVVGRFNARNRVQLALGDVALATRVVGGTFRHDEVETFLRLLESSGEIAVDRSDPARIVLHRAP
jgi:transmembrane sensor